MKLPRLLPLNPLFLKSRVCFIRSLISDLSSFVEPLSDKDRCLRESDPLMAGIAPSDGAGDVGREGRGVRALLTCRNFDSVSDYPWNRFLDTPYLLKRESVNRSINACLAYEEIMIDDGHMVFGQLDV